MKSHIILTFVIPNKNVFLLAQRTSCHAGRSFLQKQKGSTRHFETASDGFDWLAEHGFNAETARVSE